MRDLNDARATADQLLSAALAAPSQAEREWLISEAVRLHAEAACNFEAHLQAEARLGGWGDGFARGAPEFQPSL
jgi:hypothetical protein